ncbi:MAG: carboxynorspermidine decarboxylase [Methylococcaceae bacterium]|jgi:carboxynorspermidine decarboxylase
MSAHLLVCPETPAFIYDEALILQKLALLAQVREDLDVRVLYSVKALPCLPLLTRMSPYVDGYSVSSLFEARLAAEALTAAGLRKTRRIHITTPGLRAEELPELADLCDAISFNSLEQCQRLAPLAGVGPSLGVRVNPGRSFLADVRYDPCRPRSKLGVPLSDLQAALDQTGRVQIPPLAGLHFHTVFESRRLDPLRDTLAIIEAALGPGLSRLDWLNLGGGYLFDDTGLAAELAAIVGPLRQRYGLEVYIEPGKAIVGEAGTLLASVIDCFEREGMAIAVLDTGVHHLPEVFEYQKPPPVAEHCPEGDFPCLLVGNSCLAGDVFGEYRFEAPLTLGDRIRFTGVGAYAMVKASRFNGHNLPALYLQESGGAVNLMKRYDYEDYHGYWSA